MEKTIGGFNQIGGNSGFNTFGGNGGFSGNNSNASGTRNNGEGSVILSTDQVLNGVAFWGDFTNLMHYTFVDDLVAQVSDISGYNLNAIQSSDTERGVYQPDLLNGLGGLVLQATKFMYMGTVADFKFLCNGSPSIVFMILKRNDSNPTEYLYVWNTDGGSTNGIYISGTGLAQNVFVLTRNMAGVGNLDNSLNVNGVLINEVFQKVASVFVALDAPGISKEIFAGDFSTPAASVSGLTATIGDEDGHIPLQIGGYLDTNMSICELGIINPAIEDIDSYLEILSNYAVSKYNL